jgi:serine/threonine protein kinase
MQALPCTHRRPLSASARACLPRYATVYRAYYQNHQVAVKELLLGGNQVPECARRNLQKEALVMHNLRHPNIVQLYGVVMEPTK